MAALSMGKVHVAVKRERDITIIVLEER